MNDITTLGILTFQLLFMFLIVGNMNYKLFLIFFTVIILIYFFGETL